MAKTKLNEMKKREKEEEEEEEDEAAKASTKEKDKNAGRAQGSAEGSKIAAATPPPVKARVRGKSAPGPEDTSPPMTPLSKVRTGRSFLTTTSTADLENVQDSWLHYFHAHGFNKMLVVGRFLSTCSAFGFGHTLFLLRGCNNHSVLIFRPPPEVDKGPIGQVASAARR